LIASLQILTKLASDNKKISDLANIFQLNPQILKNIRFDKNAPNPMENKLFQDFIMQKDLELKKSGRILVRKSGTENLLRIMIEGKDFDLINKIADEIIVFANTL
jgi:phosphoglucosamine mutase